MPVLDLASSDRTLPVDIAVAPASELLLLLAATGMAEHADFEVGSDRLAALVERTAPDLDEQRAWIVACGEKVPASLLALLLETGPEIDIEGFVTHVRGTDPERLHRILRGHDGKELTALAERDPAAVKADVVALLEGWSAAARELLEEGRAAMERDAAARRARATDATADELVEEATNGVKLSRHPGLESVLLLPSYVFRPWVLLSEHEGVRIICYPVADEFIESADAVPPARLVKLFKALGDEGRLRLLRRLSQGSASLAEAAELLDVAKSTAHHHLAILRQAGLVLVDAEDNTYSLRAQQVPEAAELLDRYLASGPSD